MSYRALCDVMSQKEAEELGRWLALYHIQISGLQVWQIMPDGTRVRDDATAAIVQEQFVNVVGNAAASGPVGAAMTAAGCSIMLTPAAMLALLAAIPILLKAQHAARKDTPGPLGKRPIATELIWDIRGESAAHRPWTEYLLGCYVEIHHWFELHGAQHPGQVAAGRAYAVRNHRYPPPWSQQPAGRRSSARRPARRTPARLAAVRRWLADL